MVVHVEHLVYWLCRGQRTEAGDRMLLWSRVQEWREKQQDKVGTRSMEPSRKMGMFLLIFSST